MVTLAAKGDGPREAFRIPRLVARLERITEVGIPRAEKRGAKHEVARLRDEFVRKAAKVLSLGGKLTPEQRKLYVELLSE